MMHGILPFLEFINAIHEIFKAISAFASRFRSFPVAAGIQSGTPTAYEKDVPGSARGGGGANYTGENSGTATANAGVDVAPEPEEWLLVLIRLAAVGTYVCRKGYFVIESRAFADV